MFKLWRYIKLFFFLSIFNIVKDSAKTCYTLSAYTYPFRHFTIKIHSVEFLTLEYSSGVSQSHVSS